jgi:uncharacterized membrane protein YfcA
MVDAARVPVYLWELGDALRPMSWLLVLASAGVMAGTVLGYRVLARIPERSFRRVVAIVLALLGAVMITQGVAK